MKFVDAACEIPNDNNGSWRTLLFRGDKMLLLNWDDGIQYLGGFTDFEKQWTHLPPYFQSNLDAACQLPNAGGSYRTLLFKGDQLLELNWDTGSKQYKINEYQKQWKNIPPYFTNNLDGACELPNDGGSYRTLLFKGDQLLELNWDTGPKQHKITNYQKHWQDLSRTMFASDLDAVCELPNDGGSYRTMLIKDDQMLVLNWDKGVQYQGLVIEYPEPRDSYVWATAYEALISESVTT